MSNQVVVLESKRFVVRKSLIGKEHNSECNVQEWNSRKV